MNETNTTSEPTSTKSKRSPPLIWIIVTLAIALVAMIFLVNAERELQQVYQTCNDFWLEQVEQACPANQRAQGFSGWTPINVSLPGESAP